MSESESVARDEFFESLLGDFLDESGQLLDRLNDNLLQLDEWVRALDDPQSHRCDDDLLNEMFRSAHSLKGLSAMLGLSDINNLTHKIENVFDAARKDELSIDGDVVELMFQGIDRLVSLVDVLKDPDAESVECESVIGGIAQLLESAGVAREKSSQADAERALSESMAEAAESTSAEASNPAPEADDSPAPDEAGAVDAAESQETPSAEPPDVKPLPVAEADQFEGLEDEAEVADKYLSIFIDETELSLDNLTETLLAIEGGGSRPELENLLVTSHRIKGSAASVGLNRAAKLAHLMEDLLQTLLDQGGALSADMTDAMLKCSDALRQYADDLRRGTGRSDHFGHLAKELLEAQQPSATEKPEAKEPLRSDDDQSAASDANEAEGRGSAETPAVDSSSEAQTNGTSEEWIEPETPPLAIPSDLRGKVGALLPEGMQALLGVIGFQPRLPLVGLKAQLVFEKLSNLGKLCHFEPPADRLEDVDTLDHVVFGVATDRSIDEVEQHLRIAGVRGMLVEALAEEVPDQSAQESAESAVAKSNAAPTVQEKKTVTQAPRAGAQKDAEGSGQARGRGADSSKPTETLRVDIDRLDQLMNLAGQLVINKARFSQIGDSLKSSLPSKTSTQSLDKVFSALGKMASLDLGSEDQQDLQEELVALRSQARRVQTELEAVQREVQTFASVHASVNDLFEAIHQLDRVSDGIQQSVMDTRMVPIGPLFARFKRVIRDITRSNGKLIQLVVNGEKTELDKRMIDELGDPLIHMVRNSADHGIELPEVREAAGKPREGTVTLDAFHRGNSIIIQVCDDGKGLDPDRILRKALDKGIVTEADAERMTPHQIFQLIWEPGLSTAEKVTEVSGRGMGMDIVKSKIEDINGTVDLDSVPGKGTTFTIKLPLTLAILPSLMVEIDQDVFAMPMESVAEIVSVGKEDLTTVYGQWTARVRGRVISLVRLNEIFTWNQSASKAIEDGEEVTLVIVGETGCEIGLAVDRVLGEEDVVIKSMAENYRNVPGVAGASILGDGRVSLILDIVALIEMSSNKTTSPAVS